MHETQALTESLLDIIRGIEAKTIMLPEFQRDFRWEMEQTYDLFDSLVREIFIGTIIYGKPSFGMTLREIDMRPRKGAGSRAKLTTHAISTNDMKQRGQTQNFRIVLDGQQRLTSLYRAIKGVDSVYFLVNTDAIAADRPLGEVTLEDLLERFAGEESRTAISVKIADAYHHERQAGEEEHLNAQFARSSYAKTQFHDPSSDAYKWAERIYRRTVKLLIDFFKKQKMVAFYLLDMSLDKFCLFFERSNSRGIQLNFTDILAAKLYSGFNLRRKIEEFEAQNTFKLNRELVIRTIAYIRGSETGGHTKIDKSYILQHLEARDFERHWDAVCTLYVATLTYLIRQHYILSQDWIPSENMLIPFMLFLREIRSFDQMTEPQRQFIEYWYWGSIFANRYSTATNEVIVRDIRVLQHLARGERFSERGYFARLRSVITEYDDLFSYTKRASSTYRGVLNLINYAAQGLKDWRNAQVIDLSTKLEDHHIYPRGYINSAPELDMDQSEAEQLVDCVVNRTLMPKLTNVQVGKKPPTQYLRGLSHDNPVLEACLESHLIPGEMLRDDSWQHFFKSFLDMRAQKMFGLIERYAIAPAPDMAMRYGAHAEVNEEKNLPLKRLRLSDMIEQGLIQHGDRIYTRKHPDRMATIIDADTVEHEGQF